VAQHRDYDDPPHDQDEHVVQFGSERWSERPWIPRLLLACLVVATIAIVIHQAGRHAPHLRSEPPAPAPVTVINVGHRLLGVTAGWQLFARGTDDLVAIQLARGRITKTVVPVLQTGLPEVSFIVGAHQVIVRSPDQVPGYLIPDGAPARLITGPFTVGGPVIPGPNPDQAWVMSGTSAPSASLVGLNGREVGVSIQFQPGLQLSATSTSDGHGYILVLGTNGDIYDVGPNWSRRIPGQITAVGPTRWLALACRGSQQCRNEVIDPATGSRRLLPGAGLQDTPWSWPPIGVISPDGSTAAAVAPGSNGQLTLQLIDLSSGADTTVAVPIAQAPANDILAWSPDSKWLFVAAADGRLLAVNAAGRRVQGLGVRLPQVTQVAIRAAPG